jgi:hypothetical protein
MAKIEVIADADLPRVCEFLHRHLNSKISVDSWLRSFRVPWSGDRPNYGFMLRNDEDVLGVCTAVYSERMIRGVTQRFCNLAAWCVLPESRGWSLLLLKGLLDQRGYHFTDLTSLPEVVPIMEKLKFEFLDTTWAIMLNIPGWPRANRGRIIAEAREIEEILTPDERRIYQDHRGLGSLRHVVVEHSGEHCHIIYIAQQRKSVRCATVLHVSAPDVLRRSYSLIGSHFLRRHRALLTVWECRFLSTTPRLSVRFQSRHRKLYRSESLLPTDIDNLYSELMSVERPGAL